MPEHIYRSCALLVLAIVILASGCTRSKPESIVSPTARQPATKQEAPSQPVQSTDPAKPTPPAEPVKPKPEPTPVPEKEPAPKIGFVQKYVSLNWMDSGKVRMKAKSREFRGDEITKKGVFLDFSAELYEDGKLTATLKAPKAVVDGEKRTVTATGGVIMKSTERATTLRAQNVTWYANKKTAVGSGGVKVDSTTGQITAGVIETDTTLRKIIVKGNK